MSDREIGLLILPLTCREPWVTGLSACFLNTAVLSNSLLSIITWWNILLPLLVLYQTKLFSIKYTKTISSKKVYSFKTWEIHRFLIVFEVLSYRK